MCYGPGICLGCLWWGLSPPNPAAPPPCPVSREDYPLRLVAIINWRPDFDGKASHVFTHPPIKEYEKIAQAKRACLELTAEAERLNLGY